MLEENENNENDVEMEVFRVGEYGSKGSYNSEDLQRMADDYRPELLEAPLTFDHAQSGPAYGWVSRLRRDGDRLVAVIKGVPDAVRRLVRNGAYKKRSVELFRKLPHTGRPYLRAVSLLGAATPEVKGLRDVCFASSVETCSVPLDKNDVPDEDSASTERNDNRAAAFADDVRDELLESRVALMFSELRADGYCLPATDAQALRRLVMMSRDASATNDNGESPERSTLKWLDGFLRQSLLRAPLGENADARFAVSNGISQPSAGMTSRFSEAVEPSSLHLHNRALAIQAESPEMVYRDALTLASRRG